MPSPKEIIDQLSHGQAPAILQALAAGDEQLANHIAELGTACLSEADSEEVSAAVCDELDALEIEKVWDRAGKTRHGYVDTSEAAYL